MPKTELMLLKRAMLLPKMKMKKMIFLLIYLIGWDDNILELKYWFRSVSLKSLNLQIKMEQNMTFLKTGGFGGRLTPLGSNKDLFL